MLQLLNKFAWFLCFALSFGVCATIFGRDMYDGGFLVALIAAIILKAIFFPKDYILSRLQFFKTQLLASQKQTKKISGTQDDNKQVKTSEDTDLSSAIENKQNGEEDRYQAAEYREKKVATVSEPGVIEKFFSENVIAKVGGIILFIGVLVFLSAIYAVIGPVAKIVIGFLIGCSIYAAGVFLDSKGYTSESRITLGVGILVNYLVILSGRYLLGVEYPDNSTMPTGLLTVGTTFLFLILNTIFAVVTALVYNSRSLLVFGFVFAYLNPFLLGTSSSEPYTLLGYTMIITLGAMYVSYLKRDEILFPMSFILAGIIFLIAPFSDTSAWITKLMCINVLGIIGIFVATEFKKRFSQVFETMIAGVFFLIGIMGVLAIETGINSLQLVVMGASSIGLMLLSYIKAQTSASMYSVGTLASIISLTPVLLSAGLEEGNIAISVIIVIIIACINIGFVVVQSKEYLRDNLKNIITSLLTGSLFLAGMLLFYGNEFFPGISLGFSYFGLASIYALLAFYTTKVGVENMKKDENYANIFYTISAIAIALFTGAIAIVFGDSIEIVAIVWLMEANVLLFLAQKTRSYKVALAGLILMIIGILKFLEFAFSIGTNMYGEYTMLVPMIIIGASLLMNLRLIFDTKALVLHPIFYGIHNFFHVIGIGLVILAGSEILKISGDWNGLLYLAIAIIVLGEIYKRVSSAGLQITHSLAFVSLMLGHILLFGDDMGKERMDLILSTAIGTVFTLPFLYEKLKTGAIKNTILLSIFALYLFIISTLYILEIFEVTFAVTLYWGVLSFIFLRQGINRKTTWMRTIGLYLLTLTVGKIFLHDLWQSGVDDGVGFIVFMATGGLMIGISTMYKKLGNNMAQDLDPSNIFSGKQLKNKIQNIIKK